MRQQCFSDDGTDSRSGGLGIRGNVAWSQRPLYTTGTSLMLRKRTCLKIRKRSSVSSHLKTDPPEDVRCTRPRKMLKVQSHAASVPVQPADDEERALQRVPHPKPKSLLTSTFAPMNFAPGGDADSPKLRKRTYEAARMIDHIISSGSFLLRGLCAI